MELVRLRATRVTMRRRLDSAIRRRGEAEADLRRRNVLAYQLRERHGLLNPQQEKELVLAPRNAVREAAREVSQLEEQFRTLGEEITRREAAQRGR